MLQVDNTDSPQEKLNEQIDELKKKVSKQMENLNEYRKRLNAAVSIQSSEIFPNADEAHGAISLSLLFNNTKNSAKILSGNFSGFIFNDDEYVTSLENCLKRNVTVEALLFDEPVTKSKGYQLLEDYKSQGKNITIKLASPDSREVVRSIADYSLADFGQLFNFSIFDENKYRIEYKPEDYRAIVSFNNAYIAKQYSKLFDVAFSKSELILA